MGNDQSYIYGDHAMIKLIEDPEGSFRLKVCPAYEVVTDHDALYDEVDRAVSIGLNRDDTNRLIRGLRKHRNRMYGRDE